MFTSVILLGALLGITVAQDSKPKGETLKGIASNCNAYHTVKKGDDCNTVASKYDITRSDFLKWNPAVSDDCAENFWVNYAYCVGVDERKSDTPSTTAKSASSTTGKVTSRKASTITSGSETAKASSITGSSTLATSIRTTSEPASDTGTYSTRRPITSWDVTEPTGTESWPPKKTQEGQPKNCNNWHQVGRGETCQFIANTFGPSDLTLKKFLEWNPALGDNCSGLYNGWYVCVGVRKPGSWTGGSDPSTPTIPTPVSYIKTTTSINFEFTPSPTHSGQPENCSAWYQAKKGDTCKKVTDPGFVSEENFFKWNPVLKSKCDAMETGYWYCISAYGSGETNTARPPTVTTQPSAVPSGQTEDCEQWYQADKDETCEDISIQFGTFTEDDFIEWNPSVGTDCSEGTVEDLWYCVAVPGTATTRSSYTPGPTTPPGTSTSSINTSHYSNRTISSTGSSMTRTIGNSTVSLSTTRYANTTTTTIRSFFSSAIETSIERSHTGTSQGQASSTSKTTEHHTDGIPASTRVASYGAETTTSVPSKSRSTISMKTTFTTEVITITTVVPCRTTTEPGAPSCTCDENGGSTAYVTQVITVTTVVPCETDIEEPIQTGGDDWPNYSDTSVNTPTKSNDDWPNYSDTPTNTPTKSIDDWPSYTDTPTRTGPVTDAFTGYTDIPSWTTSVHRSPSASNPGHSCSPQPVHAPNPHYSGISSECRRFYLVHHGDNCERIAEGAGIEISDFFKWNPSVDADTCSLKHFTWYCIGITNPVITIYTQFPKPTGSCN